MPIALREATLDDVEAICDVNLSAFSEETVSLQTLPRESGTGRAFTRPSVVEAIQGSDYHVLVITDDELSDEVIAFAKWKIPGAAITDPPPASAWPQDGDPQLAVKFFGSFARAHREIMGDRRHWYLELVATRKGAGGKGAASRLMNWGLERAQRDGLPVFLEATKEAEGIYEGKFGFKVVKRQVIDVKTEMIDVPFMVWGGATQ